MSDKVWQIGDIVTYVRDNGQHREGVVCSCPKGHTHLPGVIWAMWRTVGTNVWEGPYNLQVGMPVRHPDPDPVRASYTAWVLRNGR